MHTSRSIRKQRNAMPRIPITTTGKSLRIRSLADKGGSGGGLDGLGGKSGVGGGDSGGGIGGGTGTGVTGEGGG